LKSRKRDANTEPRKTEEDTMAEDIKPTAEQADETAESVLDLQKLPTEEAGDEVEAHCLSWISVTLEN
jgi:hypothetical protein